jgi:hypothetical protein
MKVLWCWRCKMEMPMLNEAEFGCVYALYRAAFRKKGEPLEKRFQPVCDLYKQISGYNETDANAIMHHRISLYGDPCGNCAKPLRTPNAAFCAACGWKLHPGKITSR